MNHKFLAVTMASIMSLNVFPVNVFRKTVHAEITFKSNVGKIAGPTPGGKDDQWDGNYVYFGNYPQTLKSGAASDSKNIDDFEIEPIKWRVLDPSNAAWTGSTPTDNGFAYNIGYVDVVNNPNDTTKGGRQNAPVGGNGILLYSDIALDAKQYNPTHNAVNELHELCWGGNGGGTGKGCALWAWLNGYGNGSVWGGASVPGSPFLTNAFSDAEQNVIMPTKVYSEDLNSNRGLASSARTSLTEDKIFLLSYNEMLNTSYGFTSASGNSNTRSFQLSDYSDNLKQYANSWLRSPGYYPYSAYAAYLYSVGYVDYGDGVLITFGICPAFNLNPTSVIFASEADEVGASDTEGGGKKSMAVSSTPAKFELPTGTGNEYKLTLHDESRDNFTAEKTAQNGNEILISYSNAKTGENEYISCMILDEQSEIKYYGKLAKVESESGEVKLTLPEEFKIGDKVNVAIINEKCHESNETDLSNWPNGFEVTVEKINEETSSDDKSSDESETKIDFSYNEKYDVNTANEPDKNENEIKLPENRIVEISDGETKKVEYEDGTANITAKKSDDILEIEIKDEDGNDLNIKDKLNLLVPCDDCKPETVAAEVKSDGTHKIIRDSVAKDDNICIPLNKSTKLEVINNGKNFDDVSVNHWAYDSVAFTSAHELLIGTETNIFEPELPISRSMFTQVLHNFENNPNQIYESVFDDVEPTDWFFKPVIWAAKHNATVIGYGDGRFGPNDDITREQLATILYRYFGENEIVDTDLNFADADQISDYALKAMKWAVKYGIIQGKGNNILDPKGLATRAEVAQMFQNLMLNLFYR